MKFNHWIRVRGGPAGVGKLLGVTRHAVMYWRQGVVTPRPDTMLAIVRLSRGRVTLAEIVRSTTRGRKCTRA